MDRTHPQVSKFASTLVALDDDALAALANKGLVRRAHKDLEKSPPQITGADHAGVTLSAEGQTIRLTNPAGKSTCTCSAGICRHVLTSIIFLRESPTPAGEVGTDAASNDVDPDVERQVLAIDDESLEKWAGKPQLKRAAVVLSQGYEVVPGPVPTVRLPAQNITVRMLAAAPESMICTCHAPAGCEHKAAAVLAYRAHRTGTPLSVPQASLEASSGAPRSREEVREAVIRLLEEMAAIGLSRVSAVTQQRLQSLATSAHGVDLPRLERLLKALADEVSLALRRDAAASSAAMFASICRVNALCHALKHPTPGIVGEHRSTYMAVAGSIELVGLGARQWRTRSGYHGLTVLLWQPQSKHWTAWSDARPVGAPGFDPVNRFHEDGPWPGCSNPKQAASTKWRLAAPHRNAAGRITSRAGTRGIAAGKSTPDDGPLIRDFANLADAAHQAFAPGLVERRNHSDLVLLAPSAWSESNYDPVTQETTRLASDAAGLSIRVALRHSDVNAGALTILEQTPGSTIRAVLGSLRIDSRGLFLEPVTLWTDTGPVHLTLESAAPAPAEAAMSSEETSPDEIDEADDDKLTTVSTGVGQLLRRAEAELLSIAEAGVETMRDLARLRQCAADCHAVGLASCAVNLDALLSALERFRKSTEREPCDIVNRLLRAAYVLRLGSEWTTVCVASPA